MISNSEKNQIRSIIVSPAWGAIENLKKELIEKIRSEPKVKDSEWETIKATLIDEGQVQGIERLFNELFKSQIND